MLEIFENYSITIGVIAVLFYDNQGMFVDE